jgi:hypothetical protein
MDSKDERDGEEVGAGDKGIRFDGGSRILPSIGNVARRVLPGFVHEMTRAAHLP